MNATSQLRQKEFGDFQTPFELSNIMDEDARTDGLRRLLRELQVSHTGFYTPDELEYYEQLDIYKSGHADRLKALFPPDGVVRYPGAGIAPRLIDGRYFVDFIYAGTPAAGVDILTGDELLTVDGRDYSPVDAFMGKIGRTVKLTLRREPGGDPLERDVAVAALNPTETFAASTAASGRVIERGGGLLSIPVADVTVDGRRLEGVGVAPTVPVDFAFEYSQGRDPRLEAAVKAAAEASTKKKL